MPLPVHLRRQLEGFRQCQLLEALAGFVDGSPDYEAAILVGSWAAGGGDHLSDLDLILIVRDGCFANAWEQRRDLQVTGSVVDWAGGDRDQELTAHKWLTPDMVLVECLMATAGSGVRLADPHLVIVGHTSVVERLERRPPISRDEFTEEVHPIEAAYDRLKAAVRGARADTEPDDS